MFSDLPLTALRAFESAARLGSFKAAAAELAVTPTAISHQIRALETDLGLPLFERLTRGVELTECGERLFHELHGAFLKVAQTIGALRPSLAEGSVMLSTTPAFAALWLIPRLGRFYAAHAGIKVRLDTRTELVDLERDASVDLAIRYAAADDPRLYNQFLLQECFAAYGAPSVLPTRPRATPTLIGVRFRSAKLREQSWAAWCQAAGVDWLQTAELCEYDEEHYALQAAIAGQGLVLASSLLVSDSLANGLLVPYRPEVTVPGATYVALCVPGRERHPPVSAFLGWLSREVADEA